MIVYQIMNKINSKKYIGLTAKLLRQRWAVHKCQQKGLIGKAIKKYGPEAFVCEVIDTADTWEELQQKEREWIAKLNPEYNQSEGGEGCWGYKHTTEAKAKISKSNLGNTRRVGKKHSAETKAKMSASQKARLVANGLS